MLLLWRLPPYLHPDKMTTLSFSACAKVNIGLKILGKREDGYHSIHTLFQELDFHDSIQLRKAESGCEITSNNPTIPTDESNICCKGWEVMKDAFPQIGGASVHIEKKIPIGAGLGGGSSNAAAVLKGLNELYSLGLSASDLERLALRVGADVPFFICAGTQLGEGIGEKLTQVKTKIDGTFLLIFPHFSIDTAWAYSHFKKRLERNVQSPNFADILEEDSIPFELFENDFESVVIPAHPEISDIKAVLKTSGAMFASLSGSGSTVFGIFSDEASATEAEQNFKPQYRTVLARPV